MQTGEKGRGTTMILYFSGTGNSRYAAERIGLITGDELLSINARLKSGSREDVRSDRPLVFVCPTYCWRMPRVVDRWIWETRFQGNRKAYFVLTCGAATGNAAHYAEILCRNKNWDFMGLTGVVMPENYVALFETPGPEEAERIIRAAEPALFAAAEQIRREERFPGRRVSPLDWLKSGPVNPMFYAAVVSAEGFRAADECISCGTCADLCPLNNIRMEAGRPRWGENCTHCMACLCGCPAEAVQYKGRTEGKPRYWNDERPPAS